MGKRREPRILARLQVRIAGIDASGPLLQMVTTRNISWQGALLDGVQGQMKPGEIIALTYKNNKARFRVNWVGETGTGSGGQIGVQSVDPAKCIWDATTLPPTTADAYTAPSAKERRQHRRVQCRLGTKLHIEGAEALVRGEVTNLSVGGCFVEMSTLPEDKSRLKLIIWANDSKVVVKGIVASRRPGFGISIKFTEMTEEVREQLARIVQSHLAFSRQVAQFRPSLPRIGTLPGLPPSQCCNMFTLWHCHSQSFRGHNRHRGSGHPLAPATPPDMRVRIRRFSSVETTSGLRRKIAD